MHPTQRNQKVEMNNNDPDKFKHPCKQYADGRHGSPCGEKFGGAIVQLVMHYINQNTDGTNRRTTICGMGINNFPVDSLAKENSPTSVTTAGSRKKSKE